MLNIKVFYQAFTLNLEKHNKIINMKTRRASKSCSFFIIAILVSTGCNSHKETHTNKESAFTKIDSLRSTYLAINDSIVMSWNIMINDDNEKLSNLERLLQEISYAGGVDSTILNAFGRKITRLKALRYDQNTMSDSDLIDSYDTASQSVTSKIINFAMSHPQYERYALMSELVNDIIGADSRILHHRIHYDQFAKDYNLFIEVNEPILDEIESDIQHNKKPLFELAE